MSSILTLIKYELKKQFPIRLKKEKSDLLGSIISFVVTFAIIGMFIYFLSIIAKNYMSIKIDKVLDTSGRAYELLNILYLAILFVMIFLCLESMRKILTDKTDKHLLLRLPVKEQSLFLSKLLVLMIKNYILAFVLIVPTNIIIYLALNPSGIFWLMTFIAWLVFPIIVSLFTSILIVPYIKVLDFVKNKYVFMFVVLSILLALFVLLYMGFLTFVQSYLETGYIKFLFNEEFINTLQSILTWAYPVNCIAGIVVGKDLLKSFIILVLCVILSCVLIYFIAKKLYHVALYKSESKHAGYKKITKIQKSTLFGGLLKKELISVYREPKHIFSYLVIATIMPILVYCCYTLFESLIINIIGIRITYALALFTIILFTVLTNTFCATNITRDGVTIFKQKTLPITAKQVLSAKVVFCSVVSLLSVLITVIVLVAFTTLTFWDGMFCLVVASLFTISQIVIGTRMDLKNTKLTYTMHQIQRKNSSTVAKVVALGLVVSLITGVATLITNIMAKSTLVTGFKISGVFAYLLPLIIALIYTGLAIWYYLHKLQKSFDKISM